MRPEVLPGFQGDRFPYCDSVKTIALSYKAVIEAFPYCSLLASDKSWFSSIAWFGWYLTRLFLPTNLDFLFTSNFFYMENVFGERHKSQQVYIYNKTFEEFSARNFIPQHFFPYNIYTSLNGTND